MNGGIGIDVLFLDVLCHLGRDPGLGPGHEQAALARQVGKKVGHEVAEDMRVSQDALTVTGDGGAQCLMGFSLCLRLRLAHLIPLPDLALSYGFPAEAATVRSVGALTGVRLGTREQLDLVRACGQGCESQLISGQS